MIPTSVALEVLRQRGASYAANRLGKSPADHSTVKAARLAA
jgi:hypothetical protein